MISTCSEVRVRAVKVSPASNDIGGAGQYQGNAANTTTSAPAEFLIRTGRWNGVSGDYPLFQRFDLPFKPVETGRGISALEQGLFEHPIQ